MSWRKNLPNSRKRRATRAQDKAETAESVEGGIDKDPSVELIFIEHIASSMDANVYNAKLKEVKKAFANVDRRIKQFGPDDVTLEDKDTYKDYLEKTRKLLEEAQDAAFDLRSELENSSVYDGWRNQEIVELDNNAMWDCIDNAREIKNKIVELKNCQDRTDQEIRENRLNSKDCEKQLDDMTTSMEAVDQDSIGVSVNEHTKNTFDAIDMGTNESTAETKADNDVKKPTVKTIALILIAAQKFKKLLIKKKIKEGKADVYGLQSLNLPPPKFTSFTVPPCEPLWSRPQLTW